MGIIVIDQSPELYWFVSNALLQDEIPLKHLQSIQAGEANILAELPEIVILNGDDKTLIPEQFINRMRNHVFARNTHFIVFTSDTSPEFKKALLIAGTGQILYRNRTSNPSPKFFAALIKWFLNYKSPDAQIFDHKPMPFSSGADFCTYGRIGWISSSQCMIETNIDLNPGQSIEIKNPLFDELNIQNLKLVCIEKNKVGRYYQYSNSILCKISSKDQIKDQAKIEAWIKNNHDISKHKPIKIVYFENNPDYRDKIKQMIKIDKRYCARGYTEITDFEEIINYQLPHLILINRELIQKDKAHFEILKTFVKSNFCYCITYANSEIFDIEEFRKNYEFAMHSQNPIDLSLLESMVKKLEEKLPKNLKTDDKKIYLNKHSAYSRISLHSSCQLKELTINGVGIEIPFSISNLCGCEISSNVFGNANLGRAQFFRSFIGKTDKAPGLNGIFHRLIFVGQTLKDNELVKSTLDTIAEFGFELWLKGETQVNLIKQKK